LRRWPGEYLENSYIDLDRIGYKSAWPASIDWTKKQFKKAELPAIKTHTTPCLELFNTRESRDFAETLIAHSKIIHMIRDPRPTLASYQLLIEGKASKTPTDFHEFLFSPHAGTNESPVEKWCRHYDSWSSRKDVFHCKYEDVLADPQGVSQDLRQFIGLADTHNKGILPPKISSRWQRRWMRLTQIYPKSTAILGRGKDGCEKPLNWREFVSDELDEKLRVSLQERCEKIGYKL